MIRSSKINKSNLLLALLIMIILVNLNIKGFNSTSIVLGKSSISNSSIEWEKYTNESHTGIITLVPSDPQVIIPIQVELPLYSLLYVSIKPANDPNMVLCGLPIKYTYSSIEPSDDFKIVSNITKDDSNYAGENNVWVTYQRINHTTENISVTLTLDEEYNDNLVLNVYIAGFYSKYSLSDDILHFRPEIVGEGKNQTFLVGFYNHENSTGSINVHIRNYNTTSRNNFSVTPGEYTEITARTISNVTIDPEISSDSFKEAFNITITCELSKKVSGIIIFYPIRPYYYLKQIDIESATFWLFPNLLVSLCFVLVIRKGKKTNKRNVNY